MTLSPSSSRSSLAAFSGVYFTGNNVVLNSADYITFDTQVFDTDNYRNGDSTPVDFVIPTTGYYLVTFDHYDPAGDATGINCVRNRAGAGSNIIIAVGIPVGMQGTTIAQLNATDTVSLRYFGASPSTIDQVHIAIGRIG